MTIAFWILAAIVVGSALGVVLVRDIFRAALLLILCFLGIAGLYATLNADFLSALQVLVYVGAVAILIIFAVMLTREYHRGSLGSLARVPAFIVSAALMVIMIVAISSTAWPQHAAAPGSEVAVDQATVGGIGGALFGGGGFVLPFEIASVLLLAAIIGALVIARAKE